MSDNNSTYIKSLQAQIDAAKAETDAVRAELEVAKAEARAVKADAEAAKAEAEALMAEAEALKAEAEALMAEAEVYRSGTNPSANEIPRHEEPKGTVVHSSGVESTVNATAKRAQSSAPSTGAIAGAVSIASMGENEKIPKERVLLFPEEYQKLGVTNFKATVLKDYDYDGYSMLAINGEYDGNTSDYLIIMPMVFNASGELIGADFDEIIKQKIRSHKTYSMTLKVPNNEQIAWIEIRIVKDPVFLS